MLSPLRATQPLCGGRGRRQSEYQPRWQQSEQAHPFSWVKRPRPRLNLGDIWSSTWCRKGFSMIVGRDGCQKWMLSLAFDWTISFSWLMWPRETEMFSLSSRQSRYWVLLPLHQVTTHLPSCELTYLTKHGYLLLPCFIHASSMLRCQVNYLGPCIRFPGAATQWSVEVCLRLQLNGPILLCICKCDLPFNYPLELN